MKILMRHASLLFSILFFSIHTASSAKACEVCAQDVVVDQSTVPCMIEALNNAQGRSPARQRVLIDISDCTTIDPSSRSVIPVFSGQGRGLTAKFVIETSKIDCLIGILQRNVGGYPPDERIVISFRHEDCG